MDVFLLVAGGVLLYFGAEWLVGGASQLAASFRIPELVIGLTVVAYGTSAPEAIVSIDATLRGHGEIALGNVVGSNIANIGLILGLSVLIRPARVDSALRRRELPVLLASTLAVPLALFDGELARWEAIALLVAAIAYTTWAVLAARGPAMVRVARTTAKITADAADLGGAPKPTRRARSALVASVGCVALMSGGHAFVAAATSLARAWGMSDRVVGLTLVAVGTSLPELATSVIAAARGHSGIVIGNVVGSNIFNILLCLGSAGSLVPIAGRFRPLVVALSVLVALTIAALAILHRERTIRRWEGALLLLAYLGFMAYLLLH